jgi:hypothetical protein
MCGEGQAPGISDGAGQLPRGSPRREQAMVLIGLIIIAVVLMALMVPGVPGIQR